MQSVKEKNDILWDVHGVRNFFRGRSFPLLLKIFKCDSTPNTKGISFDCKGVKRWLSRAGNVFKIYILYLQFWPLKLAHTHTHTHHHHFVPPARVSLTLSRHSSLSFIASGRSSGLHPASSQNCCMYVRADRPEFVWLYERVHWSTSLMNSSLLFRQCPACLVCLTWIVFVMRGKLPYCWCFVGCCPMTCSILLAVFLLFAVYLFLHPFS